MIKVYTILTGISRVGKESVSLRVEISNRRVIPGKFKGDPCGKLFSYDGER